LVTIHTLPYFAAFNAKLKPAIPEPITKKSVFFIGNDTIIEEQSYKNSSE
jgi:hypothetical protein